MMNVYISADIEGICGVATHIHSLSDGMWYQRSCEWMTREVNAAVEGALEAGAKRVVVKDSHASGTNINLETLHPEAELITGWGPLGSMVEGVSEDFAAVMLIGYHARATTVDGTLAHTWSGNLLDLQINGRSVGEAAWAAAFAGHFGVPVSLITGDDKLIDQVREELPQGFHTVCTKTGLTARSARMRPIHVVRQEIREAAARSLADVGRLTPFRPDLPVTLTLRFRHWEGLSDCAAFPGVERLSVDTFQCQARDFIEAQKYFITLVHLARTP
jgi:D-amino peptidase